MLVSTSNPRVSSGRADAKLTPDLSAGRFDGRFLPLHVDWTRNLISPTKHAEEDEVGRNRDGKGKEDHEYGESCEGDRECARGHQIGRVGGHEDRRADRSSATRSTQGGSADTPAFAAQNCIYIRAVGWDILSAERQMQFVTSIRQGTKGTLRSRRSIQEIGCQRE